MGLDHRLKRLEQAGGIDQEDKPLSDYQERWAEAYLTIAATMRPDHLTTVNASIIDYHERKETLRVWEYMPHFLAARVYHLALNAAQGFHAVLRMPPPLAEVWIAYERDLGACDASGRYAAHHSCVECEDCGAEFPRLRPHRWGQEAGAFTGPSKDYVDACLLCGGKVGFHCYSSELQRVGSHVIGSYSLEG